jgi:hypothetical protein
MYRDGPASNLRLARERRERGSVQRLGFRRIGRVRKVYLIISLVISSTALCASLDLDELDMSVYT